MANASNVKDDEMGAYPLEQQRPSRDEHIVPLSQFEPLREARAIIAAEAQVLTDLSRKLDPRFCAAVDLIATTAGCVLVTGVGKAGLIGQKIAATLASTGTRAFFLDPTNALHGDLGCSHAGDVVLALSNSGETEELCRLLPWLKTHNLKLVAITASEHSTLAKQADVVVAMGTIPEAGQHGLAPSSSTTAMLAVGDALALVLSHRKGFTPQQFAKFHPAGSLGQRLMPVREFMRKAEQVRIASDQLTVCEVYATLSQPGRRTGAVMLVDENRRLTGIFTDSDLARLLEHRRGDLFDSPVASVMTVSPTTVGPDDLLEEVIQILAAKHLSELPVLNDVGTPIGLVDITDLLGLVPFEN